MNIFRRDVLIRVMADATFAADEQQRHRHDGCQGRGIMACATREMKRGDSLLPQRGSEVPAKVPIANHGRGLVYHLKFDFALAMVSNTPRAFPQLPNGIVAYFISGMTNVEGQPNFAGDHIADAG